MTDTNEVLLASYVNRNKELEKQVTELQQTVEDYRNRFGTYTKEQSQLLLKIQRVKNVLLNSKITKTGYNNYTKYSYFELQDITPVIIPALLEEKLASKFYMNDERIYLQIIDTETGAWDQVSTKLKVYPRHDSPKGDLTYLMKDEQAAQTYARRTLWLLMLDIVEPVPEEVEKRKTGKTPNGNGVQDEIELPDDMDEILSDVFKQIKHDFKGKVPFNKKTLTNKLNSMRKSNKLGEDTYNKCIEIVKAC